MADYPTDAFVRATRDFAYDDGKNPLMTGQVIRLGGYRNDTNLVKVGYLDVLDPQPKKKPKKLQKFLDRLHLCGKCGRRFLYDDHRNRCGFSHEEPEQHAAIATDERRARRANELGQDRLVLESPKPLTDVLVGA